MRRLNTCLDPVACYCLLTMFRSAKRVCPSSFFEITVAYMSDEEFQSHFRCSREVLLIIKDALSGDWTHYTDVEKAICIFLWQAASGDVYRSLGSLFGLSTTVIGVLIKKVSILIRKHLFHYITNQLSREDAVRQRWLFGRSYNQPDCAAAIDGVFIEINRPKNHGESYFSGHKKKYGLCMLAVVDYNAHFLFINVGNTARLGDLLIFQCSALKRDIENHTSSLGVDNKILVDSAFSSEPYLVKSTERIGAGSARVIVEHAFGQFKQQSHYSRLKLMGPHLMN